MATITFFTRAPNSDKKVNVRVRFRHGKKINFYAKSGLEILPSQFSNETHTINKQSKYKDKDKDKKYLDGLEATILESYKDLKDLPTSDWLTSTIDKYRFPNKYELTPVTLFSFIQDFIDKDRINPNTNKPVSYKVKREYHATFNHLKKYSNDIDFNDIDLDFYDGFKSYLEAENLALNTVGKKIQTLKVFLNEATARGINKNLKYKSNRFRAMKEESENIYLNEKELQTIFDKDLTNKPKLEKVRDLFLVGCWTGLRFGDWNKVKPENIKNGFLTLKQNKTGKEVVIPIDPTVNAILNKYDGNLPRIITNQRFNEYLKEIAKLANLKQAISKKITRGGKAETTIKHKWEMVTTHTARRSFATNMYEIGVPSISIMEVTGHKTETAFLKYIKVTPMGHAQIMKEIRLRSGNHLRVAK